MIDPVLKAIQLSIADLIAELWDTNFVGSGAEYKISNASSFYDSLNVNILHYPVVSEWVYFKPTVEVSTVAEAFKLILKMCNKHQGIVQGTVEGGSDISLMLAEFSKGLERVNLKAGSEAVKVRLARNSGVFSEHVYVEYDIVEENDNVQRLVLVLVVKKSGC